jgi:hypothetical protein
MRKVSKHLHGWKCLQKQCFATNKQKYVLTQCKRENTSNTHRQSFLPTIYAQKTTFESGKKTFWFDTLLFHQRYEMSTSVQPSLL